MQKLENALIKISLDGNFLYETIAIRNEMNENVQTYYNNHLQERKNLASIICPHFAPIINSPQTYIKDVLTLVEYSLIKLKNHLGLQLSNDSLKLKF